MIRTIHQFVIGTAVLTLFLSVSAVNVQASIGPCEADDGQVDVTACAGFLAYVRDSMEHWNESTTVYIPESTMEIRAQSYTHDWDANPVAYVPESTMMSEAAHYVPNWDANDVAYVPESTMEFDSLSYARDWDANPVAYVPESTMEFRAQPYAHDWDANPVAYIPESTMDASREVLGFQSTGR